MQTSGFFTAQQLDDGTFDRAYTSEQFAYYFSKFIGNGVFVTPATQLQVSQSSNLDMSVNVNIGDAYINGYWFSNDSVVNVAISNATGSQDRIDMVVLRWNSLDRQISIAVVEGTPSSNAQAPELTRSDDTYEICLAKILVNKTITRVTNSLIVDTRSDSNLCGYVKGVVDQIDATNLFQQFTAEFNDWYENTTSQGENDFNNWFNNIQYEWQSKKNEMVADFDEWFADAKTQVSNQLVNWKFEFETWFEDLKVTLDGDVATNLKNQINELSDDLEIVMRLFAIGDATGAKAVAGYQKVSLYWTDPNDIVLDNKTVVTWAGTLVIRKEGSAPESKTDGDIVVNSTVRNQYSEEPFVDDGLENNKLYYYRFFPYTTDDRYITGSSVSATPEAIVISATPTVSGTYLYTGSEQTAKFNDYNSDELQIGGDYKATNAGTYTVTFKPYDGYLWSDGTSDARSVSWTINKIAGTLTLSATSASLTSSNKNASITASNYVGTLSVSSSNSSVAIGTVVSSTIVVSSPNDTNGSATLTVTVAESTNYYSTSKTISVTCKFAELVSWSTGTDAQITAMINAYYNGTFSLSQIKSVWSVGDVRTISLSAMDSMDDVISDSHVAQSQQYMIIDFDHDTLNTSINGKTNALITVHQSKVLSNGTNAETGAITSASLIPWNISKRRTWCNSTFKNALPSYIQNLIKPVIKSNCQSYNMTTLVTTVDDCFFLSETEIVGYASDSNASEGTRYSYYSTQDSHIKYSGNASTTGTTSIYWLRSSYKKNGGYFLGITTTGSSYYYTYTSSKGIAPAFCL